MWGRLAPRSHLEMSATKWTQRSVAAACRLGNNRVMSGVFIEDESRAFFDGLKAAVNFIYDNLRKAVKTIFELAKKAVLGLIELARMAIVGLIKTFGAVLKGIVSVALAAFPRIAKKINSMIDRAVDTAVEVVNTAAHYLKKGVAAVLDFLANTIDSLLGLIQSLYNGLFTVIGMLIRGEFKELMDRIGSLVDAAKEMPSHLEGAVWEQLLGVDISKPMPGEPGHVPASGGGGAPAPEQASEAALGDGDIAVEPIATDELDAELVEDLGW